MATVFTIEMLDAKHGDALLLHYGDSSDPQLMIIDGGPSGAWNRSLRKRLEALRAIRGTPLPISLVMVSHVDDDHIRGLLDMTDKMERREDRGEAPHYVIDDMWFNTFDDIVDHVDVAAFSAGVNTASLPSTLRHSGATLASIGQGRTLRDRANRLGLSVNGGDPLITDGWEWDMGSGLTFTVIGPSQTRLEEFQEKWDKEVKKEGWATRPAAAEVAAFLDKSPTNLASTVILAELGGKSILFTGDARGDDILLGLEEWGLMSSNGTVTVDVLKVPHHGSDRNVSTDFFRRVKARHYLVSGNGEHKNPDIATLQMIVDARGNASYTVHSTYRVGIKGHKARMDGFLSGLSAAKKRRFVFRPEGDLSMKVDLKASFSMG